MDGVNQIWAPAWAREARGRFYYISDEEVISLKDGLQRGVEILTKAHMEDGVSETQDISDQKLDKFDKCQQKTLKTFTGDNAINGYLTGKVDGSLLEFNVYPICCKQYQRVACCQPLPESMSRTTRCTCLAHRRIPPGV